MISADPDWLVSEYIDAPRLARTSRRQSCYPRVARFPVSFPLEPVHKLAALVRAARYRVAEWEFRRAVP